jgi:hypothetical protein
MYVLINMWHTCMRCTLQKVYLVLWNLSDIYSMVRWLSFKDGSLHGLLAKTLLLSLIFNKTSIKMSYIQKIFEHPNSSINRNWYQPPKQVSIRHFCFVTCFRDLVNSSRGQLVPSFWSTRPVVTAFHGQFVPYLVPYFYLNGIRQSLWTGKS